MDSWYKMAETFIAQDLFFQNDRKTTKSSTKSLTCYICKKELDGISITGKNIKGKTIFLCSSHFESTQQQIISGN